MFVIEFIYQQPVTHLEQQKKTRMNCSILAIFGVLGPPRNHLRANAIHSISHFMNANRRLEILIMVIPMEKVFRVYDPNL